MNRTPLCLVASLICLSLHGCSESKYEHLLTGKVVDRAGKPVAGAEVRRVRTAAGTDAYGIDAIYRRKTDRAGSFSFVYQGHGPEPAPVVTWHLRATGRGFGPKVKTLRVRWGAAQRYERRGIEIVVDRK